MSKGKTLIVKVGDKEKGWIPSEKILSDVHDKLIAAGLDKKFDNIIVSHYAVDFEIVDTDKMTIRKSDDSLEVIDEKDLHI